tara:strand:+ start:561 stop:830 length:270 start_codon:yes stop_codon:yes gene_type:complete
MRDAVEGESKGGDLAVAGDLAQIDLELRQPLGLTELMAQLAVAPLLRGFHEAHAQPARLGACGASGAVDVGLGGTRQLEVHLVRVGVRG